MFRKLASYLVIAVTLYGLGFAYFYSLLPKEGTAASGNVDVLVVFTGGSKRIDYAKGLVKDGYEGSVLITGVDERVTKEALLHDVPTNLHNHFTIDYTAKTTLDNVGVVQLWLANTSSKSIGLVTSYYHMPRSLMLLNRVEGFANVTPFPVFPEEVPLSFMLREYHKFVLTQFGVL